jgi:hypothetical protein
MSRQRPEEGSEAAVVRLNRKVCFTSISCRTTALARSAEGQT